jgi:FKBP-type peptidyl-prolyl cis-trans isomerase
MKKILAGLLALVMGTGMVASGASGGEDFAATQEAFLAANAKKQGWTVSASGLQAHRIGKAAAPTAKQPNLKSTVKVHYEGKLINGKIFDSSFARKEPFEFPLEDVIQGWQEGVQMMRVGETWEFAIPSAIGYGPRGAPPDIPGGAVLLFKVELLDSFDFAAEQEAFLATNAKKQGWTVSASGLQAHRIGKAAAKDAKQPTLQNVVKVHYEGKLINGTIFDSSFERKEPIEFPLFNVIKGWQEGVAMMRVGETWEFAIPSGIGYGPRGAPPDIPGGAVLLFKVELLDVR